MNETQPIPTPKNIEVAEPTPNVKAKLIALTPIIPLLTSCAAVEKATGLPIFLVCCPLVLGGVVGTLAFYANAGKKHK